MTPSRPRRHRGTTDDDAPPLWPVSRAAAIALVKARADTGGPSSPPFALDQRSAEDLKTVFAEADAAVHAALAVMARWSDNTIVRLVRAHRSQD